MSEIFLDLKDGSHCRESFPGIWIDPRLLPTLPFESLETCSHHISFLSSSIPHISVVSTSNKRNSKITITCFGINFITCILTPSPHGDHPDELELIYRKSGGGVVLHRCSNSRLITTKLLIFSTPNHVGCVF